MRSASALLAMGLAMILFAASSSISGVIAGEKGKDAKAVRLAVVITPYESGLLDYLLSDFTNATGIDVEVYSGHDVYERARAGKADLVISHYGRPELESFVLDGRGHWPRAVFSNQSVIIGPSSDPASVRDSSNALEAFERIAASKSPFIPNLTPKVAYLSQILQEQASWPVEPSWVVKTPVAQSHAAKLADDHNGYFIWGARPFLKYKAKHQSDLEILHTDDPILQRVMVSTVVAASNSSIINLEGAQALQDYLLSPEVQSKIASFRSPDSNIQLWWPAGRNN